MTEIKINIKFKEYEFRRVKLMGTNPVIYTKKEWVNKEVIIIPVPITVSDRWVETKYNNRTKKYDITIESDIILKKKVKKHSNIGRVYVPKDLIGLDCLVIEAPSFNNF